MGSNWFCQTLMLALSAQEACRIHWWAQQPASWEVFWGLSQGPFPKVGGQQDPGTSPGGLWVPMKRVSGLQELMVGVCVWGVHVGTPCPDSPLGGHPKKEPWRSPGVWGVRGLKESSLHLPALGFTASAPAPPPRALLGLETSQRAGRGPFSRPGPGMPLQGPPNSRPCTHFAEGKANIRGAAAGAWTPRLPFAPARLGVESYAVPAPGGLQILSRISPTPARRPEAGRGAGPPAIMTGSAACGWGRRRKPEGSGYF